MKPKFIDLFAGCGGMTLGFKNAGFEPFGFVEFWKPAIMTHLANFPECKSLGEDITKIPDHQIHKWAKEKIHLICGGPPCQGFSMAGKRDPKDPRNSLFMNFLKWVEIIEPDCFVMENVPGLYSMKNAMGEWVFNIIMEEIKRIGYNAEARILTASNYCVPQLRKRLIFIGSKKDKIFFPEPENDPAKRYVTVNHAIGDLGNEPVKEIQHYWITGNSQRVKRNSVITKKGKTLSRFNATEKRLYGNRPANTITKSGRYFHPKYSRFISVRETARLHSFPDDFRFCGTINNMLEQIGNAVPPRLAQKIGETIMKNKEVIRDGNKIDRIEQVAV